MAKPVRRIVTGHNDKGKSTILMDGPAPNSSSPPGVAELVNTVLWITDSSPASNRGREDASPKGRQLGIEPPSRGSVFRVVDFPPDKVFEGVDVRRMMEQVGGAHVVDKGQPRHAMFHKTHTVDYAIVMEGEIWAMLDEGETLMRAGEVLIQRGTNHSWSNRSSQNCRIAFILIDAEPG
jgi:quercetin dioxygenase-like cupin family protein